MVSEETKFLTVEKAVTFIEDRFGVRYSKAYMNKMRSVGHGPCFHRFGPRVAYDTQDLIDWMVARHSGRVASTRELPDYFR